MYWFKKYITGETCYLTLTLSYLIALYIRELLVRNI